MVNIICHRGIFNNKDIIENTKEAFIKAIDKNLMIELDIRMTKDNVVVVFHDDNLKRLTGIDKKVSDLTYKELKEIKLLDTNSTIPTFEEILNLVNGKIPILVEIKEQKNKKLFINKISYLLAPYQGEIILQSFSPSILIKLCKSSLIRYKRGILISSKNDSIKDSLYKMFVYNYFIKKDYCKFLSVHKVIAKDIKAITNKDLYIWTIRNKEEYDKYIKISNNLICEEKAIML